MTHLPQMVQSRSDEAQVLAEVAKMAALLSMPNGGQLTEHLAREYRDALAGMPLWAVRDASTAYRFGRVGDGKWMPKPGEFAIEVRKRVDDHHRVESHKRAEQRQIAEGRQYRENIAASRTPEAMARFQELWERQLAKRAEDARMEAEERLKSGGGDVYGKVHARFDDIARKELTRHLQEQDRDRQREWPE